MASYNKVTLLGNLTRDPEMRYSQKGTAVAAMTLAVNRTWKNEAGEKMEECSFVDCTAFGRTAEVASQYVKKGQPLLVDGRLKQESWDDKQTGAKRSKIVVIIESLVLLGSRDGQAQATQDRQAKSAEAPQRDAPAASAQADAAEDDTVPF